MLTKLSDYVVDFLVRHGIDTIFMVSGGGIMHLTDSVGRNRAIRYICNHHEQACAIAAEGYARMRKGIGVCLVTTGPGSTNALSGLAGAWMDSIPVLAISGQVRRDLIADYRHLRQLGPQEVNIIEMARPVTKYAATVMNPDMIRYELERAWSIATSGRPGPVWLSLPLDVQSATVVESNLLSYHPPATSSDEKTLSLQREKVSQVVQLLQRSRRPILIAGNGIHLACAERELEKFVAKVRAPVLLTIGAMDLMGETDEYYMGKFGPIGQRRANFALQNADLVISLGASMSVASIGFNTTGFAPRAKKVMVNIDEAEINKPTYTPDTGIAVDIAWFLEEFLRQTAALDFDPWPPWLQACAEWKEKYPPLTTSASHNSGHVNSYVLAAELAQILDEQAVVLTGNALDAWSVYQAFRVKKGQRVFTNVAYGSMGWDIPAAIGACMAQQNKRTILVTGDGSFQFNVQELLTIGHNGMNIKIIVLNNGGYESIRATQKNFFGGRFVGADANSGISNPDYQALARAYGLQYAHIKDNGHILQVLPSVLASTNPALCEVNISYDQTRSPRATTFRREDGTLDSHPLEDMYPFLPREEIAMNMSLFEDERATD